MQGTSEPQLPQTRMTSPTGAAVTNSEHRIPEREREGYLTPQKSLEVTRSH